MKSIAHKQPQAATSLGTGSNKVTRSSGAGMPIKQSHVKPFRQALLMAGSSVTSYRYLSVTYQLQLPMATPFSPEQLAWLEAKFSGPTPPHSSAGSGEPTGTGTVVAGSSEDVPTDAATGES